MFQQKVEVAKQIATYMKGVIDVNNLTLKEVSRTDVPAVVSLEITSGTVYEGNDAELYLEITCLDRELSLYCIKYDLVSQGIKIDSMPPHRVSQEYYPELSKELGIFFERGVLQ